MQRNEKEKAPLRSDVSWYVHDRINKRACLHIDGWCFQDGADHLYFALQMRRAGKELLSSAIWRAQPEGLYAISDDWRHVEYGRYNHTERHINTAWARKHAPWLIGLHRDHIMPVLRQPRDGFKGYVSVRLHYINVFPNVDPFEGLPNYYGRTSEVREVTAVRPPRQSDWDAQQRSVLRTLQKLLD